MKNTNPRENRMSTATAAQINEITRLAGVSFLSQVPGLSQRESRGGMTQAEASWLINRMRAEAEANERAAASSAEPVETGELDAATMLDMVGRTVWFTTEKNPDGFRFRVDSIIRHPKLGICLDGWTFTGNRSAKVVPANVRSWRIEA